MSACYSVHALEAAIDLGAYERLGDGWSPGAVSSMDCGLAGRTAIGYRIDPLRRQHGGEQRAGRGGANRSRPARRISCGTVPKLVAPGLPSEKEPRR
jgi:hypothetical protein